MSVRARVRAAWALLVACLLGWPVSHLLPERWKEDIILGLSWAAMVFLALDILSTQDVRRQQERTRDP